MRLSKLKIIDQVLGLPICFLLNVLNGFKFNYRRYPLPEPKNIMVLKFWGIGSIVLALPLIKTLKYRYPQAKITLVTISNNKQVRDLIPEIDAIILLNLQGNLVNHFWEIGKFILKVRRARFDLALDLEFFTRFSAIITFLSNAKNTVGFHAWTVWRGHLHTLEIPFNRYWHISQNFANLLAPSEHIEKLSFSKEVLQKKADSLKKHLRKEKVKEHEKLVVFNVNVGELALERRWPAKNFAELTDKLVKKYKIRPVFIGMADEAEYVNSIINSLSSKLKVINLTGSLSLLELAALFNVSELVISNDSGPLHIAVAVGVATVSFFGPETPLLYGPLNRKHLVLFADLDCSPCINAETAKTPQCRYDSPECLQAISVDMAFKAITQKYDTLLSASKSKNK